MCDLPRHPNCGLSIDHHQSNAPSEHDDEGVVTVWRQAPSAARIAYDLLVADTDLSDLSDMLGWVDKLDGGGHANACGCRIQALENGARVSRVVTNDDIEGNLAVWLEMWAER